MNKFYTASKSRSQGREYYSIIFRHPVIKDNSRKSGLRIRRGLGADNPKRADELVQEMNKLLSTPYYWSLSAKEKANEVFSPVIIRAFYEPLESKEIEIQELVFKFNECHQCGLSCENPFIKIDWLNHIVTGVCPYCGYEKEIKNED